MKIEKSKLDQFLNDIIKVYKCHNLLLAHEDTQGAFIIQEFKEENVNWLKDSYFDNDYPENLMKNLKM